MTDIELSRLRAHAPGESLMQQTLELQSSNRPRGWLSRFFGKSPVSAEALSWFTGARGERAMAAETLSHLSDDWVVLHSVGVGTKGSDIDHVLIGPTGIVTVNTKAHAGADIWVADRAFMVNGQKQPYIRNSLYEAQRVRRALQTTAYAEIPITPVIVVLGAKRITRRKRPQVAVIGSRGFARWLHRLPSTSSDANGSTGLAEAVGSLPIWAPSTVTDAERQSLLQQFAVLEREWSTARWVRRLWSAALLIALIAVLPWLAGFITSLLQHAFTTLTAAQ